MKIVISAFVIVILMIGAPAAQSVLANQADTQQEAGIATDKVGRPCTEGPNHDECHDQFLERTANMSRLPSNQHYGECEAVGPKNELGCDVINDDGSPNPPTRSDGTPNVPSTSIPCKNTVVICQVIIYPCTFGPKHVGCRDVIADDGTDITSLPGLLPNQHYGICKVYHELRCNVVNDTSSGGQSPK